MENFYSTNLTYLLEYNQITQKQLAGKIGVSRSTIAGWISENKLPSAEILQQVSRLFYLSIDTLIGKDLRGEKLTKIQANEIAVTGVKLADIYGLGHLSEEQIERYKKKPSKLCADYADIINRIEEEYPDRFRECKNSPDGLDPIKKKSLSDWKEEYLQALFTATTMQKLMYYIVTESITLHFPESQKQGLEEYVDALKPYLQYEAESTVTSLLMYDWVMNQVMILHKYHAEEKEDGGIIWKKKSSIKGKSAN